MTAFVVRRTLAGLMVCFYVSVATFLIFQVIPNGDPALRIAGRGASPDTIAAVTRTFGLDQPVWVQYVDLMKNVFQGSVISYSNNVNVLDQIRAGLPATFSLAIGAAILWMVLAVIIGIVSSRKPDGFVDRVVGILSIAGVSIPTYVLAAVLLYFLSYRLNIFPNGGYVPLTQSPLGWLEHLLLPWICLSLGLAGFYSRVLRSSILQVRSQTFVQAVYARGVSERRLLFRHVLRLAAVPLLALWGLDFAGVVGGGAILIETIFNLHGVGQYAQQSIGLLDVPAILVIVLLGAFLVVFMSVVVDVVQSVVEPRIRID
ncbi:MAG: ABC transporter permease [Nakamurella sp.]